MNRHILLVAISAALVGMTASPHSIAEPAGDMEYAQGPSFVYLKDQDVIINDPCLDSRVNVGALQCSSEPGSLQGALDAVFDVESWNSASGSNEGRIVTAWAEYDFGGLYLPGVDGFAIIACVDDDGESGCSQGDDYAVGFSNNAISGSERCEKDTKGCDSNLDGQVEFCVPADANGDFGSVTVSIGAWADEPIFGENLGAGLLTGNYEVYLDAGSFVSSC